MNTAFINDPLSFEDCARTQWGGGHFQVTSVAGSDIGSTE
jgi:hypothetical protein